MKVYLSSLAACPLFEGLGADEVLHLLDCLRARVRCFDRGQTVMAEGEAPTHIGVVLSGGVQIVQNDYVGNRSILSVVTPTGLFSEAFACAQLPTLPVTVVAAAPSEILLLDCRRVLQPCDIGCEAHRSLVYRLLRNVASTTVAYHQKIDITSRRTTRDKLMTYLLRQAQSCGSRSFSIPFDRQGLADYLEVDRSGLSSEIGKLRRAGVLTCQKQHFTLL